MSACAKLTLPARLVRYFAFGVSEARKAEIDRENLCAGIFLRDPDGVIAGAAAGDQDIDGVAGERSNGGGRKNFAQIAIERDGFDLAGDVDPARIGVFLVLPAHFLRDRIFDLASAAQSSPRVLASSCGHRRICWVSRSSTAAGQRCCAHVVPAASAVQRSYIAMPAAERGLRRSSQVHRSAALSRVDLCVLGGRCDEDIFVDETLPRQRAAESELGSFTVFVLHRGIE